MLEDLIYDLGPYWASFFLAIVPGAIFMVWWCRLDRSRDSRYGTTPASSELPTWMCFPRGGFWARWRASIWNPRLPFPRNVVAYMGHHALSIDPHRVVLRANTAYYRRQALYMISALILALFGGGANLCERL